MFKIESYITPVILSYVEKYVKNFKPEQSQVSLWGGDASFQNLDLRLEVLEEQLNLPFTFVSGHIHELIIHVPWSKITSEPIVITINTIECILNLKDRMVERSSTTVEGAGLKAIQEESPPGYIKSIVTKVINNITINCNNLILKFVEEDIVLSVNVRFLSMQTVNELWEPTFADVSSSEVTLRKIISVEDLTLCLDKMDTAGKIEIYQDPVLYRCSMVIRLMLNYHSGTAAKSASLTRFDLHCEKMEFSMTEQQLPMLLRLISLITSLGVKQPSVRNDRSSFSSDDRGADALQVEDERALGVSSDGAGWGGWAWNVATSFLPVNWDPDWSEEEQVASTGHTIHMGVYIDEAVLTFKTVETLQEQLFYKSRKIRYNSFIALRVTSAVVSMLVKGASMNNLQLGLGSIRLQPEGVCSCGYHETSDDGSEPPIYIEAGTVGNDYLKDSLFDKNFVENAKWKNRYSEYNIDFHLDAVSVKSMLERGPAFGMDMIHFIEIPDDFPTEKLAEFESNFEYSNFPERKVVRYVVGDVKIQLCTGLMHRINTVKNAAKHDYSVYMVKKPEPSFHDLPPVTVEEYEALRERVSVIETQFNLVRLMLEFQLTEHSASGSPNSKAAPEIRCKSLDAALARNARLSVEASQIEGSIVEPMYPFRLASCASQQTDIAPEMLNDCYTVLNVKISGLQSQLYFNENCHTTIVMPCNGRFNRKTLIYPQYWQQTSVNHDIMELEMDDVTLTGTKAKLMVAASIPSLMLDPFDRSNPLFCSSLFADACNEKDPVYLEVSLENVLCKRIKSLTTVSIKVDVNSVKAFALNDTQQAFVLSGPEIDVDKGSEYPDLLSAVLQYSEKLSDDFHSSILSFRVSEMRGCLDPLLLEWLCYQAVFDKIDDCRDARQEGETPLAAEDTHSDTDVRRKIFRTLHESVHSSSDKEKKRSSSRTDWSKGVSGIEDLPKKIPTNDYSEIEQESEKCGRSMDRIAQLYPFWRKLVLCGSIGHFVIYVPTVTMDGIGVAGIEPAKERALGRDSNLHILAIRSPSVLINSVNVQSEKLLRHLEQLPSRLPMWSRDYHGFPWTLRLNNLSCYTRGSSDARTSLVSSVDLTATIDVMTKSPVSAAIETTEMAQIGLGLCIYVDTSPIMISLTEHQIVALNAIATEMTRVTKILCRPDDKIEELPRKLEANFSFDLPKTPSSYNPVVYPENTTSPSSVSTARDSPDQAEAESPVITAMIQWTITKISLKLYTMDEATGKFMKLLMELEDIISTFDWQPIYLKFKNKITTASICHFVREMKHENWKFGDYDGAIMSVRESSSEQSDDAGFFGITYTKAQSGNVHTKWGAQKHHKSQKIRANRDCPLSGEGYITEIDMSLRRMDVILAPSVVNKFLLVFKPFFSAAPKEKTITTQPLLRCDNFDNKSLPLIYLEFKGMNLMVPTCSDLHHKLDHNLLMIQLDGVGVTPSTENPICRTILRSDIYQLAAQSNILNIPGSSVEDRQYQVNVRGICACTTTWKNYQKNVAKRISQPYLYTMNENPALEWNNLSNESNTEPKFSTSLLMSRVDVRVIIAPAVILHPSKIICGGAFELTCLTDIDVAINVDQMKLLCRIYAEMDDLRRDLSNAAATTEKIGSTEVKSSFSAIPVTSARETGANQSSKDSKDLTGDSGIDFESSSVNYATTRKIAATETCTPVPLEILVNCGSVTVSFHAIATSEDETRAEENEETNYMFPFFHVMLIEPNFYISRLNDKEKIQISCFDVAVSLRGGANDVQSSVDRSKLPLVETKSGTPHPATGIPPSFLIVKCEKIDNASTELSIDMGRPTRINCSIVALKQIDRMRNEVEGCFAVRETTGSSSDKVDSTRSNVTARRKSQGFDIPELALKSEQLVLCLRTRSGSDVSASIASSSGRISRSGKFEKIHGNIALNSLVVSARSENDTKVLVKPSSFVIAADIFWETWQDLDEDPRIKIQAQSQGVYIEFGPRQMDMLNSAMEEYRAFVNYFNLASTSGDETEPNRCPSAEQSYKDDLKAGAFQFVDGDAEETPAPYQVVFFTHPEKGMAWKYPQPRIITGLHVSPIPFEISDVYLDEDDDDDEDDEPPTMCSLEYWSESHAAYRSYVEFNLSETESSRPELTESSTKTTTTTTQAVASTWRVVISSRNERRSIAPQVLVGCLRVDSYFNAATIPNVQIAVKIAKTEISMTNHATASMYERLPGPLADFRPNGLIPEAQCFALLEHDETSIVVNAWINGAVLVDVSGDLRLRVLDYGLLEMRDTIDRLESSVQISIADETNVRIECRPCAIKFGPSIAHTLAVSSSLWLAASEPDRVIGCAAIPTRLVVANDTNVAITFGQFGANDAVSLNSRECNFYCWPLAKDRMFRIALDGTGWSLPFSVNNSGKQLVAFGNSLQPSPVICARIVSISATQKLVTFSGMLVLVNRLAESFQMRLMRHESNNRGENDTTQLPSLPDDIYTIDGNERPSTIALCNNQHIAMRLRFAALKNSSWTGDIPLGMNSKLGQPWLVKVPLQDRGQFMSIWVRIVEENIHGETRILVVMSPLYMIKSYLPVPVVIKIETPSLAVSSTATIEGRGKSQQLYCPGTFEHCHQLTFHFESSMSASNPYVPLSYSSIEEKTFFSRPRNEDIDEILTQLEKRDPVTYLPFEGDDANLKISADQPQTHVQIKYRDAGLVSSTLLLELQPWCFIFNTLGCQIAIVAEDIELCQIPHNGIVTPPKLEGTFHLRVTMENVEYASPALQLARPDWNPGFYMPRIRGLVPVDGNIQASIECGSNLCPFTISSKMHKDMKIVRIMPSHVICNCTCHEIRVACLAVSETATGVKLPDEHSLHTFTISPSQHPSQGIPIIQWRVIDKASIVEHEALYIALSRGSLWSCPIRVDKKSTARRCIAISNDSEAIPLVVTTQEEEGTTYVLIHVDDHPQLYIENLCSFPILMGEASIDGDGICDEASHFSWTLTVEPGKWCYYSTPSAASRMPDSQTTEPLPRLRLSAPSSKFAEHETSDGRKNVLWSRPIGMSNVTGRRTEQHVRLPVHGDIKLLMEKRCHTIRLRIVCMTQVQVSAHDIRTRLILEEGRSSESGQVQSQWSDGMKRAEITSDLPGRATTSCSIDEEESRIDEFPGRSELLEGSGGSSSLRGSLTVYVRGITLVLMRDTNECARQTEVASLSLSDLIIVIASNDRKLTLGACIGDLQLDNQLYVQGGFDFPVVFVSQHPYTRKGARFAAKTASTSHMARIKSESLLVVDCAWEVNVPIYACTNVDIRIGPVSAYIEDTFVTQLLEYTSSTSPSRFNACSLDEDNRSSVRLFNDGVSIPDIIIFEATNLRTPLRLNKFTIHPISVLLSVHTSIRLYVALDHSPLYFGAFEREHLATTPSGLANALTMHYLSGALFGAGWVVGSLEILGSPGGFAQALGTGLKDFVTLPIQGLLRGPWSFFIGVTQGSASLMKHLTAGTVNSVTRLASSVARNLDRLTLDNEHLQRQEESRRTRPQGMAQGLYQGLTGFGMSLLAAVAGLAHHPLQQVLSGVATPRGLVTGVGLGIVGAVTKPLSGAAELVALTGQGLLEGTGWNPLPTPRQRPFVDSANETDDSSLKCVWRLLPGLTKKTGSVLHVAHAKYPVSEEIERRVALIITRRTLVMANYEDGSIEKIYLLKELTSAEHSSDSSLLCLYCLQAQDPPERSASPIEYPEMDRAMRVRVEEFVRGSNTSFSSNNGYQEPETIKRLLETNPSNVLTFYLEPNERDYLLSLFEAAKRQDQGNYFIVI